MSKPAVVNFVQALAAVLAGNALYFLLIPYLPAWARHVPMHLDPGTVVDFLLCLVIFGAIKAATGSRRKWHAP